MASRFKHLKSSGPSKFLLFLLTCHRHISTDDDSQTTAQTPSVQVLFIPPGGPAAHVKMTMGLLADETI